MTITAGWVRMVGDGEKHELEASEGEASGLDRRTLIKRAAVVGAVAWTAPVILQSTAGAQTTCSPFITCTNYYSAKFNTADCTQAAANCVTPGPNGLDASCGSANPGGSSTWALGCSRVTVTCSGSTWTFTLSAGCRIIAIQEKDANVCSFIYPPNDCTSSQSVTAASNLSHFNIFFCCNT